MTFLSKKLNALGLSQKELAKKAGVSQPYISQVLDGKVLKYNAAKKFADAFGFNFFEILADFEGSNPDKKPMHSSSWMKFGRNQMASTVRTVTRVKK